MSWVPLPRAQAISHYHSSMPMVCIWLVLPLLIAGLLCAGAACSYHTSFRSARTHPVASCVPPPVHERLVVSHPEHEFEQLIIRSNLCWKCLGSGKGSQAMTHLTLHCTNDVVLRRSFLWHFAPLFSYPLLPTTSALERGRAAALDPWLTILLS